MANEIEIQTTRGAFAHVHQIPESEWRHYGAARTVAGFLRVADAAYRSTHPEPNAWSGHVRYAHSGNPVSKEEALRLLGDTDPELTLLAHRYR